MALVDLKKPKRFDLSSISGNSFRLELTFKQGTPLAPIDMSGYTGTFAEIRDKANDQILETFAVDLTDAVTGTIVLTLTVAQTTLLCPCNAVWHCTVVLATDPENNTHTVIGGDFESVKNRGLGSG